MSQANQISRSIASNWVALAINIGVSFFLSPFVVNKLGSVYYGIWALTMQFTGYLFLLDFGVRESIVRYTSKYCARHQHKRLNQVLTTALTIYLPVTLGCVALSALLAWLIPLWFDIDVALLREVRWAIFFVGLTIAQTFVFNVFNGILQGLQRFDIMNAIGIAMTLLRTALIVYFLNVGHGIVAISAIQFGVAVLSGVIGTIAAIRMLRAAGVNFCPVKLPKRRLMALARKIAGYGFWVLVNNIAQKINFTSDAIIVGIFLSIEKVTNYAIAGSLIEYLRTLISATAQVFNPLASKLHSLRQLPELRSVLISGSKLTVLITLPIALTYITLGERFIGLWMGAEYQALSGQVLTVLALTQIIAAPHYVISSVLYGISQHRSIALLRCGEAVANLALSILLVRKLGIVGVALGTAISHTVLVLFILPTIVCKHIELSVFRYFTNVYKGPAMVAALFVSAALLVRDQLVASNLLIFFAHVAMLSAFYVGCVYVLALNREERTMAKELIRKTLRR